MAETVDATPVYMRIRRRIEERIERGIYPTGSMIPSEKRPRRGIWYDTLDHSKCCR